MDWEGMDIVETTKYLDERVNKLVEQKLKNILKGNKLAGKIASVNGNKANVYLNGSSDITPNIPIAFGLTLVPNDEVWVERINYSDIDLMITQKRNLDSVDLTSWQDAILGNNWVNANTLYYNAGYKKDTNGFVHLRGVIKNGTIGDTAFTLPVGCRPLKKVVVPTISYNGSTYIIARIDINNNGTVTPAIGSNNELYLDSICIPAEQ